MGKRLALACLLAGLVGGVFSRDSAPVPALPCAAAAPWSAGEPHRARCGVGGGGLALGARRALELSTPLEAVTAADLESLPGLGPRLARQVIEERKKRGGFATVDEVGRVRGMGPARLEALRGALEPPRR